MSQAAEEPSRNQIHADDNLIWGWDTGAHHPISAKCTYIQRTQFKVVSSLLTLYLGILHWLLLQSYLGLKCNENQKEFAHSTHYWGDFARTNFKTTQHQNLQALIKSSS